MFSENFTLGGVTSQSMGIKIVRMSGGFVSEPIIGDAALTEVEHPRDFRPHLARLTRSPLQFTLQLALVTSGLDPDIWTAAKQRTVFGWLLKNEYQPLIFEDQPDIVYYVMATTGINLFTMNDQGYLEVTFRTNSPYAWKLPQTVTITGSVTASVLKTITISNELAVEKLPIKVEMTRIGTSATAIRFYISETSGPNSIALDDTFPGMQAVTKVLINSDFRTITDANTASPTYLESLYRYKMATSSDVFPYLRKGTNSLYTPQGWTSKIYYQEPVIR